MTSQIIGNLKSYGHWTLAPGFCFGLIVIVSCILGSLFWTEIYKPNLQKYEVSGQTFSVAFEFGALLASAERGESLADIRLRADIYLSRVFGLRDAPVLADVRRVMPEDVLPEIVPVRHGHRPPDRWPRPARWPRSAVAALAVRREDDP